MQIPETPATITELDLMKRLAAYADGSASYLKDGKSLGIRVKQSCQQLHAMLCQLNETVAPLLDRVTAKEMDVFTAHDEQHALKVPHLMWLTTAPDRRELLTPAEIGLLVGSSLPFGPVLSFTYYRRTTITAIETRNRPSLYS